jgi:hypothetical protein
MATVPRKAAAAPAASTAAPVSAFAEKMKAAKAAKAAQAASPAVAGVVATTNTPLSAAKPAPIASLPEPEPELAIEPGMVELSMFDTFMGAAHAIDPAFAPPMPKEGEQAFYKRLLHVIASEASTGKNEAGEDILPIWESLGDDGQAWYNAGGDAIEAGKPIATLAGFASYKPSPTPPAPGKAPRGAGLAKYQAEQAALKAAGTLPAKAPKAPKEPKPTKEAGVQRPGPVRTTREMIVRNLDCDAKGIAVKLQAAGHDIKQSTISTLYNDTRATLRAAFEAGLMKPDFKM